jgi:protocatechuate 3,4-dioxygenase alpha subunit
VILPSSAPLVGSSAGARVGGTDPRIVTPSQTVGPYFRIGEEWLYHADLTGGAEGPRLTVSGRVLDGDGKPVEDALLEIWHADPRGRYPEVSSRPGLAGFGRVATDDRGAFSFTVRKPGRVPGPEGTLQAPHLALNVFMRGLLRHLVTRLYFPDELEANASDPVLALVEPARRPTLVARADPGDPGRLRWDVVLQGADETVFFDC